MFLGFGLEDRKQPQMYREITASDPRCVIRERSFHTDMDREEEWLLVEPLPLLSASDNVADEPSH